MYSSTLIDFFLLKTVKNKITQIRAIKIKLKITMHAISPSLRPLLSVEHISDIFDLFWTSKLPNVKSVYIYSNFVHPWNAFWLTFGSFVPKYWIHSRLEQFKNEKFPICEISDEIMIDFNLEHSLNKLDDISFNSDGNLIVVKLIQ